MSTNQPTGEAPTPRAGGHNKLLREGNMETSAKEDGTEENKKHEEKDGSRKVKGIVKSNGERERAAGEDEGEGCGLP